MNLRKEASLRGLRPPVSFKPSKSDSLNSNRINTQASLSLDDDDETLYDPKNIGVSGSQSASFTEFSADMTKNQMAKEKRASMAQSNPLLVGDDVPAKPDLSKNQSSASVRLSEGGGESSSLLAAMSRQQLLFEMEEKDFEDVLATLKAVSLPCHYQRCLPLAVVIRSLVLWLWLWACLL